LLPERPYSLQQLVQRRRRKEAGFEALERKKQKKRSEWHQPVAEGGAGRQRGSLQRAVEGHSAASVVKEVLEVRHRSLGVEDLDPAKKKKTL